MITTKTAILGFGNPVRSDDAAGVYVIECLRQYGFDPEVITLLDMGTSAFEILFQLPGHERIILVDAAINTGEPPGTLYRLPATAIQAQIQPDPLVFLHSLKWDQALSYAKKIMGEQFPTAIEVYLIAIDDTRLEVQMSAEVRAAAEQVAALIRQELESSAALLAKSL